MISTLLFLISSSIIIYPKIKKYYQNKQYKYIITLLFNQAVRKRPKELLEVSNEFMIRKEYFNKLIQKYCNNIKFIHITGTKGKGSTCEYIASALRGKGYKTGVFTSPHLHTTCERIKINEEIISREDFNRLGSWALQVTKKEDWVNFFDVLLTLALRYYGEQEVEYVVLEAGLGGRFDSTNFVENPLVSIITSISLDHQALLGETVEEIAWHKAGIIKPNGHVFIPDNLQPSVLQVIQKECEIKNATLHFAPLNISSSISLPSSSSSSSLSQERFRVEQYNLSLALSVCNFLQIPYDGMKGFFWPCRMESFYVNIQSISKFLPNNYSRNTNSNKIQVIIDGCHNGASVEYFMTDLRKLYPEILYDIWVIVGMGKDKNVNVMINTIQEVADKIILSKSRHFRAISISELYQKISLNYHHKLLFDQSNIHNNGSEISVGDLLRQTIIHYFKTYDESMTPLSSSSFKQQKQVIIAVCGSLFTAAEGREELFQLQPSLFKPNDWVRFLDPNIEMYSK